MAYIEAKERGPHTYYYLAHSMREGKKFKKQRTYLGKNLSEAALAKARKQAEQSTLQQPKFSWPTTDTSFFYYATTGVPYLNSPVIEAYKKLKKQFPQYTLEWYFTYYSEEGESTAWILSQDDQIIKSARLFDNPKVMQRIFKTWQREVKKFYSVIGVLQKNNIQNLKEDYKKFVKAYIDEFTPALIIESFYFGLEKLLKDFIEKYPKYKKEINFLIEPYKRPFHHEERESLLKVALLLQKGAPRKKIMEKLREHQQDFFWIHNNYKYADPITIDTFYERALEASEKIENISGRIQAMQAYEQERKTKKDKLSLPFSKKEFQTLYWASIISWWQDARKKANLIADYWMNEFLKQIAIEYRYSFIELQHAEVPEILALLDGKKISKALLRKRMEFSMHYVTPESRSAILVGEEALALKRSLITEKATKHVGEVRGTAASLGVAQGRVRVVMNPRGAEFKQGEVLVTGMTRPEFVPLMKKAVAIVTNEGGLTSHAAILSRELGLPCIVGTKIATKVLECGQEVLVNANHGLVRVIKK